MPKHSPDQLEARECAKADPLFLEMVIIFVQEIPEKQEPFRTSGPLGHRRLLLSVAIGPTSVPQLVQKQDST